MAFTLSCRITIGDYVIRSVNAVNIVSSWKSLSDTCTIKLPNRGLIKKSVDPAETNISSLIKPGQAVRVELGYDNKFNTEFVGYVAKVQEGTPLTLECEDELYKLKRSGNITKSYKSVSIADLIKELVPDAELIELPKITIDNFLIRNATRAQVLEELADAYGLAVYYRLGKLFVGLPFSQKLERSTKLVINKNVIEENLIYKTAEDTRIKIKATSVLRNNKKLEVELGDSDGEVRSLFFYNITSEAELRKLAAAEIQKYKYEGYEGDVTIFGIPHVIHSEVITLQDNRYKDREGRYLVDAVTTEFGEGGFRRTVKLSIKI